MAIINSLLAVAPTGLWPTIITFFNNLVHNYALGIIILTIIIKLVMLPVDFFNRRISVKNSEMMAVIKPEEQKIKQLYKNDPRMQNQKLAEVYKKHKMNPYGSCGVMFACLAITMVVFFTLFAGLNKMSAYKITNQYEQLQTAYLQANTNYNQEELDSEGDISVKNGKIILWASQIASDENLTTIANQNVINKYNEVKESFLWIKNVWVADSPLKNPVTDFADYAKNAGINKKDVGEDTYNEFENIYNNVMTPIKSQSKVNGYFILTILTAGSAWLVQFLQKRSAKKKNTDPRLQQQPTPGAGMMLVMPILMGIFTLFYNSVFSLYILVGQLFTLATTPLINKFINFLDKKKAQKELNSLNRMKRI